MSAILPLSGVKQTAGERVKNDTSDQVDIDVEAVATSVELQLEHLNHRRPECNVGGKGLAEFFGI